MNVSFLSLRFTGNGIAPEGAKCRELAGVIASVEGMIAAILAEMGEDLDDEDSAFSLSLVAIADESIGLKFKSAQIAIALVAWVGVADAINTGIFSSLPPKARERLSEVVGFVRKKGCSAILGSSEVDSLARFDSSINIPAPAKFKGGTTVLGEVVGVGGKDPKVRMKLASGKVLSCDTTEEIAKELGHRLYDLVTCKGQAVWDNDSGHIMKFRIFSVGNFKKIKVSEAFESLAAAMPLTVERWNDLGLAGVLEEIDV